MTSLNPASQPFFPSLVRRDSASMLGAGDGDYQLGGSQNPPPPSPFDSLADNRGNGKAMRSSVRSQTPIGVGAVTGGAAATDSQPLRLGATAGERHDRVASSLSSYQSARSSPSPPNSFQNQLSEGSESIGIVSQHANQPLTSSPPESLGSRSTSVSREDESGPLPSLTQHHRRREGNQDESSADSPHPLSRSAFSDRSTSSFPAIESFLRRERGSAAASPYLSSGDTSLVGGMDQSSQQLGMAFKWEDIPSQGYLGPAPANLGNNAGSPGQPPNGSFSRVPGSRSSTFGPIGKPSLLANDLAPPPPSHQVFNSQGNGPGGTISRSMSLSLPVGSSPNQPPGGPLRKGSFAAFDNSFPPHPPPSKSPLPNSFLNYTIGGPATQQQQSANTTPTTGPLMNNHGGMIGTMAPYANGPGAENMSSSPSSVRSMGNLSEPTGHPFDSQAKSSPFINDLLDRLIRCEYSTSSIQREIGDLNRKMSILLDRVLVSGKGVSPPRSDGPRDPLSASPMAGNSITPTAGTPGAGAGARLAEGNLYSFQNGSSTSSLILQSPTPNSTRDRDRDRDEEIRQLNLRISTLNTSVTQLLQAQNHSHIQNMNAGLNAPSPGLLGGGFNGNGNGMSGLGIGMSTPGLSGTPELPQTPMGGLGGRAPDMSLGNRPSPRAPIPVRTWSSGSMEMSAGLGNQGGTAGRQPPGPSMLQDKRRSVISLGRRDSSGTVMDAGDWAGNNARDGSGPIISKWEQLSLTPELLRSIAKYGVGPPNKIQQRALPFLLRGADIIAQAPPTQERIAAYVIPAIHVALTICVGKPVPNRGPVVVIISTTVDQATQAQRMIRDLGGPIGVRSALGVGTGGDVVQELRLLQQSMPHILCGTPQKLHSLFTAQNGLTGSEVRLLVLDEVDQLIARNLHDFVFNIVKLLPPPRSRPLSQNMSTSGSLTPIASPAVMNPATFSPFDSTGGGGSPFSGPIRRMSTAFNGSPSMDSATLAVERQTALFSNTVPQDVLNLANTIQLREPVRVLVRRDGNVTSNQESSHGSRGLRQFYLYLAFTGGGGSRTDGTATTPGGGLGIIGSGRGSTMTSVEREQAREWKLDALVDLFDDIEIAQAIVHVGGMTALDAVQYKLASRGLDAIPLHGDMSAGSRIAALNKFRGAGSTVRAGAARVLVVYDVPVKAPDVFQIPLVINYDLPKAVEEYAHRVAPAISNNYSRSGIVVNFVTATGGDVEMLRSIECFYKIKCPEVPISLRDIL